MEFLKTNRQREFVYSVEGLLSLQWLGDRETHTFTHRWSMVTDGTCGKLEEATLANMLPTNLEQSHELRWHTTSVVLTITPAVATRMCTGQWIGV